MNIKVFTLSTCSTSKRILKDLGINSENSDIQDIKYNNISEHELDLLKEKCGSYEQLFSRRAQKYKEFKPKNRDLTEEEIKQLICKEYTFLKRPVILIENRVFIGNSKTNVEALKSALNTI